jgi:predicted nucleic acid-binding protein
MYLLDTSYLVRLAIENDPLHPIAVAALTKLLERGESLAIAPQNLIEFWSVATRPAAANGLGLSASEVREIIDVFAAEFQPAAETPDVYPALRNLLGVVEVIGKQVHDARLVAVCHANKISHLLTFNGRHFARYSAVPPGLVVVDPASVAAPTP